MQMRFLRHWANVILLLIFWVSMMLSTSPSESSFWPGFLLCSAFLGFEWTYHSSKLRESYPFLNQIVFYVSRPHILSRFCLLIGLGLVVGNIWTFLVSLAAFSIYAKHPINVSRHKPTFSSWPASRVSSFFPQIIPYKYHTQSAPLKLATKSQNQWWFLVIMVAASLILNYLHIFYIDRSFYQLLVFSLLCLGLFCYILAKIIHEKKMRTITK